MKYISFFILNSIVLLFPIIYEIIANSFLEAMSLVHIFLLIWIMIQTYVLVNLKNKSFLKVFLISFFVPLLYLLLEFFDENSMLNNLYIFYFIFSFLYSLALWLYTCEKIKDYVIFFHTLLKVLSIPVLYYLIDSNISFFSFYFYDKWHFLLFIFFVYLAILLAVSSFYLSKKERFNNKLLSILKQYSSYIIDKDDLDRSLKSWKINLSSKKEYKIVLFMDIRWFTSFSENNRTEKVIWMLNNFYKIAEDIIKNTKTGKINKYVADEIVIIFDDIDEAITTALKLLKKEKEILSQYWLALWIGLNAWVVIYGWIWWELKKEQTIIWDVVNTAARLEWWKNQIKAPKYIVPARYKTNNLWELELKWKQEKISVVEIIWLKEKDDAKQN